jgi:hypothetical protein
VIYCHRFMNLKIIYVLGQRLEDIDISVHCEIPIFDWLIKWVKKDLKPKNEWPSLGTNL